MSKSVLKRIVMVLAAAGIIGAGTAFPALAQNCNNPQTTACVNVNAVVPETISFTLNTSSSPSVNLVQGQTTKAPGFVAYTVQTNDPSGYIVQSTQMASLGPASNQIVVSEQNNLNGSPFGTSQTFGVLNTQVDAQSSSPTMGTGDAWSEDWSFSPANLPPATYSAQWIYVAAGS